MFEMSLYAVKAFLILDNEGKRVFAKYYRAPHDSSAIAPVGKTAAASEPKSETGPHHQTTTDLAQVVKEQRTFEQGLFKKTYKQGADVVLYEDCVVAYKQVADVTLYVVGNGVDENEVLLYQALAGIHDALAHLVRVAVDKRALLENYDLLSLVVDEAIDSGVVLEVNPAVLESRVSRAPTAEATSLSNIELSEQGLLSAYQFARGKLSERLRAQFQ
ncbi:uncharacterized protein SAPINGB_P006242 [Magnusiomyces paraingens]|uniref:Coatomer subunit zeta n=1 Tax=Magnusiomyces paraingens TaxID=2606893 RepID=A0A5E8C3Z3_9ASCO|nr:uncharacterized protein SAPINGB_P006242 [Saprochaete ingens]VVT58504.1 unnamed protein product [Saprochaete ingens]